MIFIIIILIIVIAICIPVNTEEIKNNEVEQVNIVQEEIKTNQEIEYMFIPISNGKTVQMIMIPKIEE